jgi:hypothetical protein
MQIDEQFLSEIAQDMRDNGVDDEMFISETIDAIREDSKNNHEIIINN